jgi:tetratricopeptide (TPR) repeat protein
MYRIRLVLLILLFPAVLWGQSAYDCILRAKAMTRAGKPDLAIDLVSRTLAENAADSRLYIERAEAKLVKGDFSGATLDFNIANKHNDMSGEYGLARIYALKRDAATAVYHLERNLTSRFRKSEKEIMLDPAFSVIENAAEWKAFWKKEWYSTSDKALAEIEYDVSKGNIEDAKITLNEFRSRYGNDNNVSYLDALISYSAGKNADAIKILSAPGAIEQLDERSLRVLARAQEANQNPAGASVIYSKLIEMEVADAGLFLSRAACYTKTGETGKAKADLEYYLAINPGDKAALSMAGKAASASGDNIKALSYFSRNLELHPDDPNCYIDRANSYFRSKSWNWAINDFSMALDLNPDNSEAWLSKGISLLNSGKPQDACHDFYRSLSLGNKRAAEFISKNCMK